MVKNEDAIGSVGELDTEVKDFVLDLLDREIEEVNMALRWDKTPYTTEDIDKLCESRVWVTETGMLDRASYQVCWNWIINDVEKMHPAAVKDMYVNNTKASLAVVGGVWMLVQHYTVLKDWMQDVLCSAWYHSNRGYKKYLDWLTVDNWRMVDYRVLRELVLELHEWVEYAKQGWEDGPEKIMRHVDKIMEVYKWQGTL